ncbi:MAG TPA: hypothetical protein VFI28_11325, partial [Candidatus Limnocylindrales bacterium]|nr:hypothetical protein [Candidatus Limnocylindrales bacterium]
RARTGYALLLADRRRIDAEIESARDRADPERWATAYAEGEAMDEADAADLALERAVATGTA